LWRLWAGSYGGAAPPRRVACRRGVGIGEEGGGRLFLSIARFPSYIILDLRIVFYI